jgi:diguanylate cyclase (GGDEF)-like protein
MRSIWKFPLKLAEEMRVSMPRGARILHAALDLHGVPCIWAEVETTAPRHERAMSAYGTGGWHPDGRGPYVATFVTSVDGDQYVFHLFDQPQSDPVTGLLNIPAFYQRLLARAEAPGPAALALFDIDHLKDVNDRHGHTVGEHVIEAIAERMRRALAGCDVAIGRVGGDEFAVLLLNTSAHHAAQALGALIERLADPYRVDEFELRVTVSAGVAGFHAEDPIERAERAAAGALSQAKAAGGDTMVLGAASAGPDVAA